MKKSISLILLLISINGYAGTEEETLNDVVESLEKIKQQVVKAKQHQASNKRIKIQYQQIHRDLSRMQEGILATQSETIQEPRVLEAIKGDYLELKGARS